MARRIIPDPALNSPSGFKLRVAGSKDATFIGDLATAVFGEFGDYGIFLPTYLQHPSVITTIYEEHTVPLGYIMVALVLSRGAAVVQDGIPAVSGNPPSSEIDAEVLAIAVRPDRQAQGIGKRLLLHALDFAQAWHETSGVRSVQLNVAHTNHRALAFFTHLGFNVLDSNDGTYPLGQRSIRMARLIAKG